MRDRFAELRRGIARFVVGVSGKPGG